MSIIKKIGHFFTTPSSRKRKEIALLKEHPIFRDIDSWINIKIGGLDIQSPSKKAMAKKYLEIYFNEVRNFYINLCNNYDTYVARPRNIYQTLHTVINATNEKAIAVYVPTLFIEKMNVRFFKHIDILSQSIVSSSTKRAYSTEYEQVSSILDMSLLFLHMEVDTIENTINSMNGELERILKGTVYDSSL